MISQARVTAYHEAGHAVFAHLVGIRIKSARVRGRNGELRYTRSDPRECATEIDPLMRLLIAVSGIASEARLQGFRVETYYFENRRAREGAAHDLYAAHCHLMAVVDHCEYRMRQMLVLEAMTAAEDGCKNHWTVIERVAAALLRHKRVPGSRLHHLAATVPATARPQQWFRLDTLVECATTRARKGDLRGIPMPTRLPSPELSS